MAIQPEKLTKRVLAKGDIDQVPFQKWRLKSWFFPLGIYLWGMVLPRKPINQLTIRPLVFSGILPKFINPTINLSIP